MFYIGTIRSYTLSLSPPRDVVKPRNRNPTLIVCCVLFSGHAWLSKGLPQCFLKVALKSGIQILCEACLQFLLGSCKGNQELDSCWQITFPRFDLNCIDVRTGHLSRDGPIPIRACRCLASFGMCCLCLLFLVLRLLIWRFECSVGR